MKSRLMLRYKKPSYQRNQCAGGEGEWFRKDANLRCGRGKLAMEAST